MTEPTEQVVETWDLSKMLAVLCQVAQDARDAERAQETKQEMRIAPHSSAVGREGGRL
jgi:hypothetical protein